MSTLVSLFLVFAKVGAITFGGGPSMLPVLEREIVERRHWATEEQLADYYAIGQCTPGVIAVNTATFVGYSQAGVLGGILATLGTVFPSLVILSAVAALLGNFSQVPAVMHAFAGIRACVCGLILHSVLKLAKNALVDRFTAVLFAAVLILAAWVGLSPVILVLAAGACGFAAQRIRRAGK